MPKPAQPQPAPALLREAEVAQMLSVSVTTLRNWRRPGQDSGPPWIKLGNAANGGVRYSREALAAWIEGNTIKPKK